MGACDLIGEAVIALGITEPYRLASSGNSGSTAKILRRRLPLALLPAALARIEIHVANIPVLDEKFVDGLQSSEVFQRLYAVDGIDTGEQILASVILNSGNGEVLISGDKRFVAAMQKDCLDDWKQLAPSFISLEGCLRSIVDQYGFRYVVDKAYEFRSCDESLRLAFGGQANERSFIEGLTSFDPCR